MIKFMNVISGRCNVEYKIVNLYECLEHYSTNKNNVQARHT